MPRCGPVTTTAALEKYGVDLRRPYVLTVASDDRRKNLSLLGRLAARVEPLGFDLAWAGGASGTLKDQAEIETVRRLGYVDCSIVLTLHGPLP